MLRKFPIRVTLLLLLVLSITAWNFLRMWTALSFQNVLNEFSSSPPASVIYISGGIWGIIGLILTWSIWQPKAWTGKLLLGASAGYTVWYWGERILWQMPRPNWPFAVILNLIVIIFILFASKTLTKEAYEQKPQHPEIE